MPTSDQRHTARLPLPHEIRRGKDSTIQCPVYLGGSLVKPDSGTVSVVDGSGTAVVDSEVVSFSANVAEYTILAATTSAYAVTGMQTWSVEWTLRNAAYQPDGELLATNDAMLVRRSINPVVADVDLRKRVRALDPDNASVITSVTTWQDQIDEAWLVIQGKLIRQGNRPNLIMSPSALREAHILKTLALIYEDLATRLNPAYAERAKELHEQFKAEWNDLDFAYDSDDDGVPDPLRRAATPTIWLS